MLPTHLFLKEKSLHLATIIPHIQTVTLLQPTVMRVDVAIIARESDGRRRSALSLSPVIILSLQHRRTVEDDHDAPRHEQQSRQPADITVIARAILILIKQRL